MSESSSSSNWMSSAASGGMIIAPIISSLISANAAKKGSQRTNRQNKAAATLAFERDKEMFNLANKYNSPIEQMGRYKAAGLNPNLIYGQGNSGNAPNSLPQYNAPHMEGRYPVFDVNSIAQGLGQYQDFELKQAQINQMEAQTKNVEQRTISEGFSQVLQQLGINQKSFDYEWNQILRPYQGEITRKKAEQEGVRLNSMTQALINMRQDNVLQLLREDQMKRGLSQQDLDMEMKRAQILYKEFENQWMKAGVTSHDNPVLRMLIRALGNPAPSWKPENTYRGNLPNKILDR